MTGKTITGRDFQGLLSYLLTGRKGEEVATELRVGRIELRNLLTNDPETAALMMRATARLSTRAELPVGHLIIAADDGDPATAEDLVAVADRTMRDLGAGDRQAMYFVHIDKGRLEIHILFNRIDAAWPHHAWDDQDSYERVERSLRHQERERGWREVHGHHVQLDGQTRPDRSRSITSGERRLQLLHERDPERHPRPFVDLVRENAREDLRSATSWADLEARLSAHGYRLEPKSRGMVISDGRFQISCSRVDEASSRRRLEARFEQMYDAHVLDRGAPTERAEPTADAERVQEFIPAAESPAPEDAIESTGHDSLPELKAPSAHTQQEALKGRGRDEGVSASEADEHVFPSAPPANPDGDAGALRISGDDAATEERQFVVEEAVDPVWLDPSQTAAVDRLVGPAGEFAGLVEHVERQSAAIRERDRLFEALHEAKMRERHIAMELEAFADQLRDAYVSPGRAGEAFVIEARRSGVEYAADLLVERPEHFGLLREVATKTLRGLLTKDDDSFAREAARLAAEHAREAHRLGASIVERGKAEPGELFVNPHSAMRREAATTYQHAGREVEDAARALREIGRPAQEGRALAESLQAAVDSLTPRQKDVLLQRVPEFSLEVLARFVGDQSWRGLPARGRESPGGWER